MVSSLLDCDVRLSLDASALIRDVLPVLKDKNVVITPHVGEFKRLFGEVPSDDLPHRISLVQKMAQDHGITILLKGSTDIITDGDSIYTNQKTTPAMTVGGTGDVLSGLVAAMLAKNRKPIESAAAASFINSTAGNLAQKKFGLHIVSTDLIDAIADAMKPFDEIK